MEICRICVACCLPAKLYKVAWSTGKNDSRMRLGDVASLVDRLVYQVDGFLDVHQEDAALQSSATSACNQYAAAIVSWSLTVL